MNKKSWQDCCARASKELSELGLTKANANTVRAWNKSFRENNVFPHPRRLVIEKDNSSSYIRIFDYFPRAQEMFIDIANENIEQMTGKLITSEFANTILPELERESIVAECFGDDSPGQKMLAKLLKKPPSEQMVTGWLRHFNIHYDKHCTRRGRGGNSYLSQRMKEAWASGKYANRRPKGQGLQKGEKTSNDSEEEHYEEGGQGHGGDTEVDDVV